MAYDKKMSSSKKGGKGITAKKKSYAGSEMPRKKAKVKYCK